MRALIGAFTVLMLVAISPAQTASLSDSPSAVKAMEKQQSAWTSEIDPDGPQISWKQGLAERRFWVTHLAMWLSGVFDVEVTHAGLAHRNRLHPTGCAEANLEPHPSRGELYTNTLLPIAAITGLDLLMRKAKMPFFVYDGGAAYGAIVHLRGGIRWLNQCW